MRERYLWHVALVLVAVAGIGLGAVGGYLGRSALMPVCQEDAVLIGEGSFEGGRWDRYGCGPAVDDYSAGTGDLNGDGRLDVLDVQLLVNRILQGGGSAEPPAEFFKASVG